MFTTNEEAECTKHDPELWFDGSSGANKQAVQICNRCPVKQLCLNTALEYERVSNTTLTGIHGGLLPKERTKLRTKGIAA